MFRVENGKVHVVDAYCPHLGANLAVGGRVLGGCIECPFHGWQFQGSDGKCVKIPYAEKGESYAVNASIRKKSDQTFKISFVTVRDLGSNHQA